MSESQAFKLPDVGEGLTEAEVVAWHVAVGDEVEINDVLVDIETAKSVVELPSPFAGVVEQILVDAGATADVGTPLIVIGDGTPTAPADATEPDEKPQVLVGPGPKEAAGRLRRLGATRSAAGGPSPAGSPGAVTDGAEGNRARTTPPVRMLARTLGVDLEALARPGALITAEDVERASAPSPEQPALLRQDEDPRETRIPVKGVRKATAEAMVRSAFTAPHVTEWLTVDVTRSMELVRRLKKDRAWHGVRVNPLLLVARAFVLAVRAYPEINASWDDSTHEIVRKDFVNLGIAAATPRGLLVPNIKDAHALRLPALADALEQLIETARAGRTQPGDLRGGTVTITNIGALGVDGGTPILNPGESAILAFGAVRRQPWVVDDEIQIREVAQLALSFDHRLVDGQLGSAVLVRTGEILADPSNAMLSA
ncbi:dihydrolipoamide acetyltransferase family protein [Nocardioides sp. LHG3406-4]|uniref:dihydrolipoamide acetyltransferase family protein n=1 Tax=Nocardioides sp. LHG3406-4 TaxID=2804575 RepID=UPI003CEBBCD2